MCCCLLKFRNFSASRTFEKHMNLNRMIERYGEDETHLGVVIVHGARVEARHGRRRGRHAPSRTSERVARHRKDDSRHGMMRDVCVRDEMRVGVDGVERQAYKLKSGVLAQLLAAFG